MQFYKAIVFLMERDKGPLDCDQACYRVLQVARTSMFHAIPPQYRGYSKSIVYSSYGQHVLRNEKSYTFTSITVKQSNALLNLSIIYTAAS